MPKFMSIAPDHRRKPQRRQRALTLLEVVVGLAILGLMSGAIYAIVSGSIESTATLEKIQAEDRRIETFLHRCRAAFSHLPAGASLELRLLENEPMRQELTLRGVPEAFVWGEHSRWDKPVVTLAPQRWPDDRKPPARRTDPRGKTAAPTERFALAMTVPDFFKTNLEGEPEPHSAIKSRLGHQLLVPDEQGRFWFELLPEIDRVEWRFYHPARKVWLEQQPAGRPPMVELRLTLPGRKEPLRAVLQTNL
jgi:prepilin-type N-terminal cleavage/methylation domain-containing protein